MAQFENSIVLRVRDRAKRAVANMNRLADRQRKIAERINRVNTRGEKIMKRMQSAMKRVADRTRLAERAMRVLRGSVQAVGKAFRAAGSAAKSFVRGVGRGLGGLIKKAGQLAALLAGIGPGALLGAAKNVSDSVVQDAVNANTAGLTISEYSRLRRFLEGANTEGLAGEDIADLITELQNRFGESLIEGQGAAFDGFKELGKLAGNNNLFNDLKGATDVAERIAIYLDALSKVADPNKRQFLAEETAGGTEGRVLNKISSLPEQVLQNLSAILDDTGVNISEADVQAAHDYRLAMFEFRQTFNAAVKEVMLPLLPKLGESVKRLSESFSKFAESQSAQAIVDTMTRIATSILGFASDTLDPSTQAHKNVASMATSISEAVTGLASLTSSLQSFGEFMTGLGNRIDRTLGMFGLVSRSASRGAVDNALANEGQSSAIANGSGGSTLNRLREIAQRYREVEDQLVEALNATAGNISTQELKDLQHQIESFKDQLKVLQESFFQNRIKRAEENGLSWRDIDPEIGIRNFLDNFDQFSADINKVSATRQEAEGQMNNAIMNGSSALDVFAQKLRSFNPSTGSGGNSGKSGVADLGGEVVA